MAAFFLSLVSLPHPHGKVQKMNQVLLSFSLPVSSWFCTEAFVTHLQASCAMASACLNMYTSPGCLRESEIYRNIIRMNEEGIIRRVCFLFVSLTLTCF